MGCEVLTGNRRDTCRVFVCRPEGKKTVERFRRRWKDNIKTDPREEGWGGINQLIWRRIGTGGGCL